LSPVRLQRRDRLAAQCQRGYGLAIASPRPASAPDHSRGSESFVKRSCLLVKTVWCSEADKLPCRSWGEGETRRVYTCSGGAVSVSSPCSPRHKGLMDPGFAAIKEILSGFRTQCEIIKGYHRAPRKIRGEYYMKESTLLTNYHVITYAFKWGSGELKH